MTILEPYESVGTLERYVGPGLRRSTGRGRRSRSNGPNRIGNCSEVGDPHLSAGLPGAVGCLAFGVSPQSRMQICKRFRYRDFGCKAERDISSTFYLLIDLVTFFDLYHGKEYQAALEV